MADVSKIFKPRRGKKSTMAGTKKTTVLSNGEMFIEVPDTGSGTGHCRMKIGDGSTAYSDLPYAMGDTENEEITFSSNTSTTVATALNSVTSGGTLKNLIAGLKQAVSLCSSSITQLNDDIASFQNGVDTIYNGCTTYGSTPTAKTPTAILESIKNIYNNRYNLGVSNTKKGNATASQVLSGYTFTSASGVNLTGTCNYKYTQDQYDANYNNGYNAGKAAAPSKYYSGTLDSNGNGSGFEFIPMIGITYGPYGWTYVFINGSVSAGKFPNKGYISFRYAYTTSSAWENDTNFSGFGNGYINWSRSALASQPFKVWGI